jgi:UDP-glucose 4-epimerase
VADRPLLVTEAPPRPGDVVGSYTRTAKAAAALGWSCDYTVEDGIRHSLEWATRRPTILGQ